MENPTKFHTDFTKNLNDLINDFNVAHPGLFIRDIDITYSELRNGIKFYTGVKVDITVQPHS